MKQQRRAKSSTDQTTAEHTQDLARLAICEPLYGRGGQTEGDLRRVGRSGASVYSGLCELSAQAKTYPTSAGSLRQIKGKKTSACMVNAKRGAVAAPRNSSVDWNSHIVVW